MKVFSLLKGKILLQPTKIVIVWLFVVFVFSSGLLLSQSYDLSYSIAYFPPPLKQIQDGTEPTNVTCTEGLELVLKLSNGKPACIKPSSVDKLIERGWAIHVLPDYQDSNNNSENQTNNNSANQINKDSLNLPATAPSSLPQNKPRPV